MTNDKLPEETQERIKADADKPGLPDRIIGEAKQFAFYNYCSAAHNADFDNLETWPYAAQVAYYAISNYMSGNPISWPYSTKTIPMDLKDVAFEAALQQFKDGKKEVKDVCTCDNIQLAAHGECWRCPGRHTRNINPTK